MSKQIQIGKDTVLASAGGANRKFLHLIEREYTIDGKPNKWWLSSRSESPKIHSDKKPDAVIICATLLNDGEPNKLVLTKEFRIPLGTREIGFPAGLIDEGESAEDAAVREFKEETGLSLTVTKVSPPNLYSSAGMTEESVQIVFGTAEGVPSRDNLEAHEEIDVILADIDYVQDLIDNPNVAFGAKAWCLLYSLAAMGF